MNQSYDFIFAGTGCAALSLAFRINQSSLKHKKILLIDKSLKNQNDRTWCFWTKNVSPFDKIAIQTWDKVWFKSPSFSQLLDLSPYQYKMIRGIDFYEFTLHELNKNPHVSFLQGEIDKIESHTDGASIESDGKIYKAQWIFNSIPPNITPNLQRYHWLKQHFLGWMIETEFDFFNVQEPILMDFTIAQNNQVRFFYVLPLSPKKALVEFTIFSANLLQKEEYELAIQAYLKNHLQLQSYSITEREFGIIPMTNFPFKSKEGSFVVNLGTSGGFTKASSGYTFMNIQRNSDKILKNLLENQIPTANINNSKRFWWYDSLLLNIMAKNRFESASIFADLFKKHPPERVLRFLDDETDFLTELRIMQSVPSVPFLRALQNEILRKFLPIF